MNVDPSSSLSPDTAEPLPTDARGTVFRPGFHRIKPDGSPFTGAAGQFMPKGGRKRGATVKPTPPLSGGGVTDQGAAQSGPSQPLPPADFSDVDEIVSAAAAGTDKAPDAQAVVVDPVSLETGWDATLRGFYGVADAVSRGKGEWRPDDNAEHVSLRDTWVSCSRAYGWKPLPPILAAIGGSIAYVWKRVTRPNTAKTLVRFFPGLAPWLGIEVPKTEAEKAAEKTEATKPAIAADRPVTPRAESYFE